MIAFEMILDERRLIGSQVLHSRCLVCADCQKSIGDGSFEEVCFDLKTMLIDR